MLIRTALLVFAVGCVGIDGANTAGSDELTTSDKVAALDGNDYCKPFSASGRAYGLTADVLHLLKLDPTPDTNIRNHDNLIKLIVNLPAVLYLSLTETVFSVNDDAYADRYSSSDTATATTNALRLSVIGVDLSSTTLRARASSEANEYGASANTNGSLVEKLVINGHVYGDIGSPTTITVFAPLLHIPLATVSLLESNVYTDAYGDSASASVNALHVKLLDGSVDVIVAHADSQSSRDRYCDYYPY